MGWGEWKGLVGGSLGGGLLHCLEVVGLTIQADPNFTFKPFPGFSLFVALRCQQKAKLVNIEEESICFTSQTKFIF